jgi:GTPase
MNDKVKVTLVSGKGGDGAIAFRREKCVDKGGPYGGNGGRGGNISLVADPSCESLAEYRFGKTIRAQDGGDGLSKLCYGSDAPDILLHVPMGTVVEDTKGNLLADLYHAGDTFSAVKGGRGGRGNACFKSSVKRTPNVAENGMPGESKVFYFELKLLADVGLVGYPNVGKSTFLGATTRAHPAIADYAFTTLEPQLGVCYNKPDQSFVIADLPGLIEGASQGKGLGFSFLRHIERCRVLLHVLDVTKDGDLFQDFTAINKELFAYRADLALRPMVIALNKIDAEHDDKKIAAFKKKIGKKAEIFEISAEKGTGLKPLIQRLYTLVSQSKAQALKDKPEDKEEKVYTPRSQDSGKIPEFTVVRRQDGVFALLGARIVRTKRLINLTTDEGIDKLSQYLDRIGVNDRLKKSGAKTGDTVDLDGFEFEYFE